jgi:hypothetical protein
VSVYERRGEENGYEREEELVFDEIWEGII